MRDAPNNVLTRLSQIYALVGGAEALLEAKRASRCGVDFQLDERTYVELDKLGIVTSLTALAGVAHGQNDPERAVRLLGAASSLRELIDVPQALLERVSYEQTVSAVRADVGGEAFDTQWQRTPSLTLDEAIAAATEEV